MERPGRKIGPPHVCPNAANSDDNAWDAGRSVARIYGKKPAASPRELARRETGDFRNYWEHRRAKSASAVPRKAFRAIERAAIGKSKRKSRIKGQRIILTLCRIEGSTYGVK